MEFMRRAFSNPAVILLAGMGIFFAAQIKDNFLSAALMMFGTLVFFTAVCVVQIFERINSIESRLGEIEMWEDPDLWEDDEETPVESKSQVDPKTYLRSPFFDDNEPGEKLDDTPWDEMDLSDL